MTTERGFDLVFAFGSVIKEQLVFIPKFNGLASLTTECGYDLVFAFGSIINKQLGFIPKFNGLGEIEILQSFFADLIVIKI